ncbi:hypothetical protein ACKWTF_004861 [Chironomus riparius]
MPPVTTKLPGRQTNNSLSSMTGNIMIETPIIPTPPQPQIATITTKIPTATSTQSSNSSSSTTSSRKKKIKPESYLETDEVLQIGMHKVLQYVKNHDDAWPFMDPVEEEIAPRYYSIIKRPMDLLKMEEKLDDGEYLTYTDFRTDFKLIVNNCRLYNGQNNEYTQMVNNLQIAFDRATKKYFDQSSSDEEQVLLEYPPVTELNNKAKRKIQTSDENLSKNDEIKHTKYSKKETVSNSVVSEKKSAKKIEEKVNKKHKNALSKLESSSKNTKRKKDKDKDKKDKNHKVIVENSENDEDIVNEDSFDEVKNENVESNKPKSSNKSKNKKTNINNFPIKEVKVGKKYNKKKIKTKEKIEKKLPKSYNKKAKNNKKIGNVKTDDIESDIKSDAFKEDKEDAYNTDFSSDESIRDLINESFTKTNQSKKEKGLKTKKTPKESTKKGIEKSSKQIKKNKHKMSANKINLGCLDDDFNLLLGNRDKEKSPALLSIGSHSNDTTSFSDLNKSSTSFEIKDKFDLIKERRNQKNLLKEKNDVKASKKSKKAVAAAALKESADSPVEIKQESPITKDKQSQSKVKKEAKDLFDELLEDKHDKDSNNKNDNNKIKSSSTNKEEKSNKLLFNQDISSATSNDGSNKKRMKQKATLDVLDLETEQTLKDINKWLEHTPRFEYNSESNSPSRYTIDDMDVHLKSDNNDFRKPIPLMPSSPPSTSKKIHTATTATSANTATFQNIVQKNEKDHFSKDIVDNNNSSSNNNRDKDNVLVSANLANKKFAKVSKKKLLGDKHQIVMKTKREIQRTTNRLQPGKTKGNLLCNLQNVMKPDEFIPLGHKEKVKDVKNSLITETDENSPKLNLGKVLDPSAFHFNNSGLEKEESLNEHNKIIDRNSDDENENSEKEQISKCKDAPDDELSENSPKAEPECSNTNIIAPAASTDNAKPNLSAWFKAFGVSKKPNNTESDNIKKSEIKNDISLMPQRRLSTGSSVSEISSVESSPHISMEDRSAPAPFPSPIGASPISAKKPKLDDINKSNYPDNGPIRVGFYQDTTSTKSSPDKSHSPQEQPLSSPYQQYSQQSNVYSSQSANVYSNFYNPESSSSTKQHQSSSNSPLYYDQYNKHFNQETSMHKSMNSNVVSPGSSHHSQQSSPYQQQPNSPYPPTPDNMSTEIHQTNNNNSSNNNTGGGGNNMSNIQSPSATYSQSNSPFHQNPTSPYHSQSLPTNQNNFNNQITPQSNMFEQQEVSQFSPNPQQPHNASQKAISNNNFNNEIRQTSTAAPIIHNTAPIMQQQQHQNFVNQAAKVNETPMNVAPQIVQQQQQQQQNQQILYPGDTSFLANELRNKKLETGNETMFSSAGTRQDATITYQEEVRRQAALQQSVKQPCNTTVQHTTHEERQDNPKYLDLSKQANRFPNQYLASNFSQPLDLDFSKNRSYDTTSRNVQKPTYPSTLSNCQLPNDTSANNQGNQQKLASTSSSQIDIVPKENPKQSAISNFIQNPSIIPVNNDLMSSHQSARTATQPSAIDMNYKQASLFNSSSASSMMELTAFMRDFRQAEDRFASISNPSTNYYDKTNPAAHMFNSKSVPQSSATTNFQQIYSNPMTTIAYGREQQDFSNYQSRLNIFQASNNTNQMMNVNQQAAVTATAIETKSAKKGKKKKNAPTEIIPQQTPASLSQHQLPTTNQQQAHQQYVHQQTFQSFPGIKVPSASSSDSSSLSIKSVVPGSAFNYGPPSIPGLYGDNSAYLEEFRGSQNPYYSSALRTAESIDKTVPNPPQAHPTTPASPYHHLLPSHPSRSYPFMNSIDPAALQQQYRMMFNQSYQAGYHLGMHQQPPPHWHM